MATVNPTQIAKTGKYGDLRRRLVFLLLALVVYRIGTHIPVPGVNPEQLRQIFPSGSQGGILSLFNMFSGGALSRFSVFALGIMPYISASIIMQMMTYVLPAFESLKKEGEAGRRKITQYTRYGTVVLALFQSFGIAFAMESQNAVIVPGFGFRLTAVVSLTAGTLFLMWLGEQITERGLGNGISIIIFAGIASGMPNAIGGMLSLVNEGGMTYIAALFVFAAVCLVTYFVVFVERGQRKILTNYARRQVGNKVYGGQSSHLPLKLNMSGVIPPIFASSIILLPATVVKWFSAGDSVRWLRDIAAALSPGQPIYTLLYAIAIIFFCFFYTALVFNSREVADNLKKSGAFIPGIRPGDQTAKYIDKILMRLTLAGAIYVTLVCLLPEFLVIEFNVPFYFGGTSLLILVVVTMDFMAQVQNYVMSQQYESLLKKASFKTTLGG
jgi:preprotein translocase subunit SecY